MTPVQLDDRLIDLLVKRASEGVSALEQAEIDRLSAAHAGTDLQFIERAAAALTLAGVDDEPLPADLRARLEKSAADFAAAAPTPADDLAARRSQKKERAAPGSSRLAWFAAAAGILIAIAAWWPRLRDGAPPPPQVVEVPPKPLPTPVPTPAEERQRLLAASTPLVQGSWSAPGDPATNPVSGDIVWDPKTQKGYMRFTGLKPNDPGQFQYQLWIFDQEQDERYPIDGGVFDIPAGQGEVIVPIDASIGVKAPVMFAVTAEKPGGVVVSSREQIVALAKVAAG